MQLEKNYKGLWSGAVKYTKCSDHNIYYFKV